MICGASMCLQGAGRARGGRKDCGPREANGKRVRQWIRAKNAGWYAVLEDPRMSVTSTLLDQTHNTIGTCSPRTRPHKPFQLTPSSSRSAPTSGSGSCPASDLYKMISDRDTLSFLAAARDAPSVDVCPRTGVTASEARGQGRCRLLPRPWCGRDDAALIVAMAQTAEMTRTYPRMYQGQIPGRSIVVRSVPRHGHTGITVSHLRARR